MALAHSDDIWGEDLIEGVRKDLINLANVISEYEPVRLLVRDFDLDFAKERVAKNVEIIEAAFDDLWIRDFGPQFLMTSKGKLTAMDLGFNGWGKKQKHDLDRKIAKFIAKHEGIPITDSKATMEGGAVETNGKGVMMATKSCIVNKNRNPKLTEAQIEKILKAQFGLKEIVWLPGIAGKDITDGHTDFYARFLEDGTVLANLEMDDESFDYAVTRKHTEILKKRFPGKIKTVSPPDEVQPKGENSEDFAAGYINYYVVNGGVICPKFGDKEADKRAHDLLAAAYPDREIEMVEINSIASGGGGIHCSTLHQPAEQD